MTSPARTRLVWVPPDAEVLVSSAPPELEVVPFADDPAGDPRIGEVEFLVVGFRDDLTSHYPAMRSLRVIQTTTIGIEKFIPSTPAGVLLCSCRGAADTAVSEWVVAAILAGQKEYALLRDEQLRGEWRARPTRPISGSTVLILGSGSIGRAVVRRLEPFGPTIFEIARRPRPGVGVLADLPDVLPVADVVIVLLPLTEETTGLVDASFLARMKPGSLLVNAARGGIVSTDALISAARAGHVRAVLDVTDPEPLPTGHPLRMIPGIFITPHLAGVTAAGQARSYPLIAEQLARFARDEELANVVADGY